MRGISGEADPADAHPAGGWYRSPAVLGGSALALSVIGYVVFSVA